MTQFCTHKPNWIKINSLRLKLNSVVMEGKFSCYGSKIQLRQKQKINDIENISSHRPMEANTHASNFADVC
jgi:hypothetical protein